MRTKLRKSDRLNGDGWSTGSCTYLAETFLRQCVGIHVLPSLFGLSRFKITLYVYRPKDRAVAISSKFQ
jgi:hypothetical protein